MGKQEAAVIHARLVLLEQAVAGIAQGLGVADLLLSSTAELRASLRDAGLPEAAFGLEALLEISRPPPT